MEPADAPAQRERDAGARATESAPDRPAEVEYKCGMFMVLPFYFIPGPAKH